jgi:Leucine-rich repeat (LRR) protein
VQLEALSAHSNSLVALPRELGQLRQMSRLSLHQNKLLEVPAEIGDMGNLQEL